MVAMKEPSGAAHAVGRLTGWEPLGFEAGDNNWYRFVLNSPTALTDPTGLVSSAHGAIGRAMATGNVTELVGLLECGVGSAAQQAAVKAAIARLNSTAQQIIANELKGSVRKVFPSEMLGKSLAEIIRLAKDGNSAAQTARKLLTDRRFRK